MYYLVFKHVTFPIKYEYIISVSGYGSNLLQDFIFVVYIFPGLVLQVVLGKS